MIKMFLEDVGRISLCFPGSEEELEHEQNKERELSKKIRIKSEQENEEE